MNILRHKIAPCAVILVLITFTVLFASSECVAECDTDYSQYREPTAGGMAVDLVLLRPLTLVAAVAGTAVYVVALPFTLLGDNIEEAGDTLVVKPMCYTFVRPLGRFEGR
jgi:hypothetical protein